MLYAKVVLGLPVEGPFDYIVPLNLEDRIKAGLRVWVSFGTRKIVGYVVALSQRSEIKNLKKILEVIDNYPLLDKNLLSLAKDISDYYACSWGEAIETMLPQEIRKGRPVAFMQGPPSIKAGKKAKAFLMHDPQGQERWDVYFEQIKEVHENNQSAIILFADINSSLAAKELIASRFNFPIGILYRKQPKGLQEWLKIKSGQISLVIGTRSAIFAPLRNLGLIIIDEEQDTVYKQDQVPHYHARQVAFMRIKREAARLILSSSSPSLESFYLVKKNKISPLSTPRVDGKRRPEIKIIDMKTEGGFKKKEHFFSKYLLDAILSTLNTGGKALLFLNRKGFATFSYCHNCGLALKCQRCNINLVYDFEESILTCHYCSFKMELPKICPSCNSGYIKLAGAGTQKLESELSRIFVQARIKRLDKPEYTDINNGDIFVSTSAIIKHASLPDPARPAGGQQAGGINFDLVGVIAIDNSLNRIDLRSSEKAFSLLVGLLGITKDKMVIQTRLPRHHCFEAILNNDINSFYDEELKQRKQLNFPPLRHMALVKLRSKKEEKARLASHILFEKLKEANRNKEIEIVSVNPGQPSKLRGNFYWQILITAKNVKKMNEFLKPQLKGFSHSGLIVTVDVDPV
ncbi:MAG: primosomal protein N' [Candidatus Omnitrophica bacterium]|nr:primosomal protein N' [Candidatus Omnitrophota bacterium]